MGIGFRSPREKTPGAYNTFVSINGMHAHKIEDLKTLLSFVACPFTIVL